MANNDNLLLSKLREILFHEEQDNLFKLRDEVDIIKTELKDEKQRERLEVFFDEKLDFLQKNFPELFGTVITQSIKKQIRESKGEVIDALYPIIGKLISKYIKAEIEKINERIDTQLNNAFSLKSIRLRLKALFSGVKYEEIIIRDAAESTAALQEIFLISQGSGMLLGKYSLTDLMDADMVGGMLTGIKSFVEHAFNQGEKDLENLEYEDYKIILYNFEKFYVACAISGQPMAYFESKLQKAIMDFIEKYGVEASDTVNQEELNKHSSALKAHFDGFNQLDQ